MYAKVFSGMFDGTLCTVGPWEALVTFQQFLVLADKFGVVDMTTEAISRRTTIPLKIIQKGVEALERPDPDSRTPNEDGRRIVRLSDTRTWGWEIVNFAHYRAIRSAEDRRDYHRQYGRKRRAKVGVNNVNRKSTMSTVSQHHQPGVNAVNPSEAEAFSEAEALNAHVTKKVKKNTKREKQNSPSLQFEKFWNCYPPRKGKRLGKGEAEKLFSQLSADNQLLAIQAAKNYAVSDMTKRGVGIRDPKRFLRDRNGDEPWRDWLEPEICQNGKGELKYCSARIEVEGNLKTCKQPATKMVGKSFICDECYELYQKKQGSAKQKGELSAN